MALVSRAKRFSLDSAKQIRDLQVRKGLPLFWDLHSNLSGRKEPVTKEALVRGATLDVPGHRNGEKYERSHEYDFRQWEQWDAVEFPEGPNARKEIDLAALPAYITDDIRPDKNPELNLERISAFRCGVKIGSKISRPGHCWVEKWYVAHCMDQKVRSSKQINLLNVATQLVEQMPQDIVVQYYSKLWTEGDGKMHGESCCAVLIDGAQHNVQDGLAFELKESFLADSIL